MNCKHRLTSRDLLRFQMADDPQLSPDGSQVLWVRTWIDGEENRYRSQIQITHVATGETRPLSSGNGMDTFPRWSPDGRWIAYLASPAPQTNSSAATLPGITPPLAADVANGGAQLLVMPADGGSPRQLTRLAGGVRNPEWSPDGQRIAFNTFVDPLHGLEALGQPIPEDPYQRFNRDVLVIRRLRWQMDSTGSLADYRSHIALAELNDSGVRLLTNGEFDLGAPSWSPDGRWLATTGNLRAQGELQRNSFVYLVDATADAPVQPRELFGLEEMRSNHLTWSPDGKTIAVCGHNDPVIGHYGNQMLWLVTVEEGAARCVTAEYDRALGDYSRNSDMRRYGGEDGPAWLPDGRTLYALTNEAGAVDLVQIAVTDGAVTKLTSGRHSVVAFTMDRTGMRLVLLIGDDMNPGDLYLFERADQSLRRLTYLNQELLDTLEMTEPIRFSVTSVNVTVDCWMVPPVGRKPGERYPLILYTGGGPGGMRASVFCHEFHLYAAHGYAVVHCNTRGNHGYGQEVSLATRGHWGDLDYQDNMACLGAACERFDFVDPTRLAVAGGSYGGYMAFWIACRHPEFKAAVVDRSLINRTSFAGDIGFLLDRVEFDRRPLWEARETYIERSPITYVAQCRTPTLVVHSAQDHRCPIDQGEQLYLSLKRLGIPTEFVRFPNESHELSRSGRPWHRVFRLDRYLEWFSRWV